MERGALEARFSGYCGRPGRSGLSLYLWWTGVEDKHLGTELILTGVACVLLRPVQAPLSSIVSFASHTPPALCALSQGLLLGDPNPQCCPQVVPMEKSC